MFRLVLLSIFISKLSFGQQLPNDFAKVIQSCDSQSVFLSIVKSKKLKVYFPDTVFSRFYNSQTHELEIYSKFEKDKFERDVSYYYNVSPKKNLILRSLKNWCNENKFVNDLGEVNPEYPPEAIMYYTKKTKHLVAKFLKLPEPKQGWYSLTTFQLFDLNFDYLNFIDQLTKSQIDQLHNDLKITAKRLSKADK